MPDSIDRFTDLQQFLDNYCSRNFTRSMKVLEAGCGHNSPVKFNIEHQIIGIDISEKQLRRNNRLHE
jgi:hypothetical protein